MVDRLTQIDAATLVRHCLEQGQTILSRHFRKALTDEGLDVHDARFVLRNGKIFNEAEHDVRTGEWNYRIEGEIPEGKRLGVVFCFKEIDSMFLITIFAVR